MTVFKNEPGTRTINVPAGSYDVITIDYTGNLSGEMWLMGDVAVSNLTLNAASKVESIIFDTHQLRGTSGNDKFDFTGIEYMEGQLSAIKLGGGNDTFSAGSAGVWVDGGSGNDTLYGGGIDQLLGGSGDDVIHGGTGSNELSGGTGKDIFVAATRNNTFDNDSLNTITDFVAGADRIDVSAYGISSFRQLQQILDSSSGGHAHFEARFGDSLNSFTLEGIAKGKLSAVDFIFFTGKAVEIVGTDEDDRLFAGSKGSVLKGGFGNNELFGGTGADVFVVSAKSGENTGQNTIFDFSASTDRIDISAYGISGFNQLKRILESKSGDTYFSPEMAIYPLSDVTIKGIDANKLSARDFIFYTGENKQIAGNDWDDRLFAAAGGSTLKGGGGFDSLYGGDGNDVLDGGKFSDIAYGGKGDDVYVLENSEDRAIESKNEGIDLVKTYWDNTTLSANIENLTLLGHANSGTGNDLDNIIRATSAGNSLKGMKGNDTLIGGADWDTLDGGFGADTMSGGKEDDTYIVDNVKDQVIEKSGQGSDTVLSSVSFTLTAHVENLTLTSKGLLNGTGNDLANEIWGAAGDNDLKGKAGNDRLFGGDGDDMLDGGVGQDEMEGATGNDTYLVDDQHDLVFEKKGEGIDLIKSSVSCVLIDNLENLTLTKSSIDGTGNALANVIIGSSGKNVLKGMSGDDTLVGLLGADSLYGGKGKDKFVFKSAMDSTVSASGRDTIFDFAQKESDRIDLSSIDSKASSTKNDAFAFIAEATFSKKAGELRFEKKAGDTIIYGDVDGDGKADFAIQIDATVTLDNGNFIL